MEISSMFETFELIICDEKILVVFHSWFGQTDSIS